MYNLIRSNSAKLFSLAFTVSLLAIPLFFSSQAIAQDDATWVGGTGNWSTSTNWNPAVVPNNGGNSFNVLIDNGDTNTDSIVSLDIVAAIDSLTVDLNDLLQILNTQSLTINGGL